MKRKNLSFVLILFISFTFIPIILAQESPRYNLASMQPGNYIEIPVGGMGIGKLYFYNIDGNRITHVKLFITKNPANWDIEIDPPLRNVTIDISGIITNVTENLYVEPSNTTNKIPANVPEGVEYIMIPDRGYAPAKFALVKVKIPENEQVGRAENITVTSVGEWLGQTGTAAIAQIRDFEYTVKVVAKTFEEKIIEEKPPEKGFSITGFLVDNATWVGIIVFLVIVILVLAYFGLKLTILRK